MIKFTNLKHRAPCARMVIPGPLVGGVKRHITNSVTEMWNLVTNEIDVPSMSLIRNLCRVLPERRAMDGLEVNDSW